MRRAAPRVFALAAAAVVSAALAMGLAITGTPGRARARRFDQLRISDLMTLSARIEAYAKAHGTLPPTLSASAGTGMPVRDRDPQTRQPYGFTATADRAYTLCATFALASTEADDLPPQAALAYGVAGERWDHPPGRHCFDFTIDAKPGPLAPPPP